MYNGQCGEWFSAVEADLQRRHKGCAIYSRSETKRSIDWKTLHRLTRERSPR
jgi:hypothetical protein